MPRVLSVNIARVRPNPYKDTEVTGMEKVPVSGRVHVRPPGTKLEGAGSGLVGDTIGDRAHHGGDGQAVYAYAREELDVWEQRLGRSLPGGSFGENLTTCGLPVSEALIGERWRFESGLELQVTGPRVPCATFRGWMGLRGWLKVFASSGMPGAYLRVAAAGDVGAGDAVQVVHRPDHDVAVTLVFRALLGEPHLLPSLLAADDDLPDDIRRLVERRRTVVP
jgi:MOSC domain-containing protein YiiM